MTLALESVSLRIDRAVILDEVTAVVNPGAIVSIVGPNGSGKTTLANVITGVVQPTSGDVRFGGAVVTRRAPDAIARRGISRTFQDQHLAWNASSLENVLVATDFQPRRRSRIADRSADAASEAAARALLGDLGLAGQERAAARDLSFGQQRLLGLARAFAQRSALLLLDEPFTGLKPAARAAVTAKLREASREGRMVLVIDHDLATLRELGGEVWFMCRGRLTRFDTMSAFLASSAFEHDYLGVPPAPAHVSRDATAMGHTDSAVAPPVSAAAPTEKGEQESNAALRAERVSAGYGARLIVHDATFRIERGTTVCIAGPNGSGKSTLLRALAGVLPSASGRMFLRDLSVERMPAHERVRRGLRFLPQEQRLFGTLTADENLLVSARGSRPRGESRTWRPVAESARGGPFASPFDASVALYGSRPVATLSGGEQARLALAQISVNGPDVILLDEPTAGIDGATRAHLEGIIRGWNARGIAVLVVEHNIEFVFTVSSRLLVMREGRLSEVESFSRASRDAVIKALTDSSG